MTTAIYYIVVLTGAGTLTRLLFRVIDLIERPRRTIKESVDMTTRPDRCKSTAGNGKAPRWVRRNFMNPESNLDYILSQEREREDAYANELAFLNDTFNL